MNKEATNLEEQIQDSTTVEQVDVNIDELFGNPGAANIMTPEDGKAEEKPKTMFSAENIDTSFLDNKPATAQEKAQAVEDKAEVEETIAELDNLISQNEEAGTKNGRPKVDKDGLYDLAQKMIEEGTLIPFDDEKSLEEYSTKIMDSYPEVAIQPVILTGEMTTTHLNKLGSMVN